VSTAPRSPDHPSADATPGPFRLRVEQASRPALEALSRLPVWLPFLALLVLMIGGGFLGGPVGWVMVGLALGFILWLLYLSWPRLTGVDRVMRVAVLLLFAVVTAVQLLPRS
jgi:Ni,Fe-hydrogenase I cytochrome b subunit